ncbi:TraE/TraK family type IV conjugative transfer system protein [Candidatus Thiothrix anitrata]|uniref:Type IV conjugative transfer system protein TraE n=1 Tax=Candidatus Thiothrix anitrata TaxID=2823902 RepID=A0ABX7X8L2_9GAMM|nr:TraE/TraK family type IV conjugative transfer system protein [Candidatus Thiothrix anitrata]QTR51568.1 hypothetical protein J8380_08525 [Candidatus Thiothrix anitrata]
MIRQQQLKDIGVVMAEKRQWQYIASGLLLALLLLMVVLMGKSHDTKTIFVPPNAELAQKPFWVADSGASPEYFQMTADYVAQLALTGDAKSAAYSIDRLMSVVHPSIRGVLKAELDAAALKMKAENVTQAFYPVEYSMGDNRPVVVIKGTLKTWVGDKLTSNRDALYRMTFSMEAGRIYLMEFVETSPHDPFSTAPATPTTGATS